MIAIIDAAAIYVPTSPDEALAMFVYRAEPGDQITIHAPECPACSDVRVPCECVPMVLRFGALA